ncbi:SIR2 family protein [Paraburkholderia sp. MM5482-R1]|uniref:SIR2 family protein n=1 Tax=unclassified Paraburkholderia TaxID=2615204 RepID=UPI003D1B740E
MKAEFEAVLRSEAVARLPIDAFVRAVTVNRGRQIALLLGAGASLSSGMPSAERCVWEWKRDIFVTNNPTLRETVGELSLAGTKARIQQWLDLRGNYPPAGSDQEYSFYAAECYPTGTDRRAFFHGYVQSAAPHTGYKLLPLLARCGLLKTIWTTNFDGLPARACAAANVIAVETGIDCPHRVLRPHVEGEVRVVSLHGDYRYDALKNTSEELQNQERELTKALIHEAVDCDIVVLGYSGRDASLMKVLESAFLTHGQTRLYWCGYGDTPTQQVAELLGKIHASGRDAFYIATEGFDDVLARIALRHLDGDLLVAAKSVLDTAGQQQAAKLFAVPPLDVTALIKSNAYPFGYPLEIVQLRLDFPKDVDRRAWLDKKLEGIDACGVVAEDGAFALGDATVLAKRFDGDLKHSVSALAISDEEFAKDGRIRSLIQRCFVRSSAKLIDVETDGRRLWEAAHYTTKKHNGVTFSIHRAVKIRLTTLGRKALAVLMPEVVVKDARGMLANYEVAKILKNEVYGFQHNKEFDADLQHWVRRLGGVDIPAWGGGHYRIGKAPWYANLAQRGKNPLPEKFKQYARQDGLIVPDAPLVFASSSGSHEVRDVNPLRGLVNNRPWDYSLTQVGLAAGIEVSVICPQRDKDYLKRFLLGLQERAQPERSEQDYLLPYPGFSAGFGLPLSAPNPGDQNWLDVDDNLPTDLLSAAKTLGQRICRGLDVIRRMNPQAIAVVYVPARWQDLNIVHTEAEHFNLHDYVKAYAARAGLSTQFIRERTTSPSQICRVRWWVSLALYAKALRTPWRLDCIDEETAYVGLGYSIDHAAELGTHVLLGCSHLYSSRGEGLQFRLGRIENPIIRGKNPFMSEDDARRTGETIRQLFFDSKMRLPSRVVVHKRTRFIEEEKRGLCQGLEGVANIELIEINIEESLRYVASKQVSGNLEVDGFPVPRGTTIVLDGHSALLWVHGSTPNVRNPNFKYFQGKRRIPAPLLIRRHMGQSDVVQVASEILGLSKMNWNTFDYYSLLPATLDSATAIAKVGTYLSGFGSAPYDYRLLI